MIYSSCPTFICSVLLHSTDKLLTNVKFLSIRIIGVGRFRILGGGGGQERPNSQQAHDVVLTSMTHRRHFLILKSDNIENSRKDLKGIILQVPSKLHLLLFYPSTWYICDFFLFHIEIEGKYGWIIGGQRV